MSIWFSEEIPSPDPSASTKTHAHLQGLGREAATGMDRDNRIVSFLAPGELREMPDTRAAWSPGVLDCAPPQLGSCRFPGLAGVIFILATGLR